MKFFEIFENSEWENISFQNKNDELSYLEQKKKGVEHLRSTLYQKLLNLASKGIIFSDRLKAGKSPVVAITYSSAKETNWTTFYTTAAQSNNPEIVKITYKIGKAIEYHKLILQRISDLTIRGNAFCFTGFRSKEMEQKIEAQGGRVATSMSKGVDYLVVATLDKASGKSAKARDYGIRIITKEQLADFLRD